MGAIVWPFLIYWLVMFVACYTVIEVAQDQLYDEVTPYVGLKVTLGSAILAALLTWLRPSYDSMFTTGIAWTVLQAIVWFVVFTLIFQFHPPHALALGIVTMLLVSGVASMGVDSLMKPSASRAAIRPFVNPQPIRGSLSPTPGKEQAPAVNK